MLEPARLLPQSGPPPLEDCRGPVRGTGVSVWLATRTNRRRRNPAQVKVSLLSKHSLHPKRYFASLLSAS